MHHNVRRTGDKRSDQGAVWASVDRELDRLDMTAPTRNFADTDALFDRDGSLNAALEDLVTLGALPGQCGVVISHGSRVVAAELFAARSKRLVGQVLTWQDTIVHASAFALAA